MTVKPGEKGTALVEFALALPVLVLLLLASVEYSTLLLMTQKSQRLAATMADLIAQADDPLTAVQVDTLFNAAAHVMEPFDHNTDGLVILSAVTLSGGKPVVAWQRADAGHFVAASGVGQPGKTAILPAGLPLRSGEVVIVAEAFQKFDPIFTTTVMPARTIYEQAYYRPRLGQLAVLH